MNPVWESIFAAIPDVGAWNNNIGELKRLAEENGPECKAAIAAEAERRGYLWSKTSRCYVHPWTLRIPNHGTRLLGVGWREGILRCLWVSENKTKRIRTKTFYEYGDVEHPVPKETAEKILRVPYPEHLHSQLVGKDKEGNNKFPVRQTDRIEEPLR